MAGDKITKEDIFGEGIFSTKEIDDYKTTVEALIIANEKLIKTNIQLAQNNPFKSAQDIKDFNKALNEGTIAINNKIKSESQLLKVKQEEEKLSQQQIKTSSQQSKANKQTERDQQAIIKAETKKAKELEKSLSIYNKLSQQLINQKKAVKDLLASEKELSEKDKELIKNTQELDKKLKNIDAQVGDNQRNVGGYKEALNDAAAELGSFGGGLSKIIRSLKLLHEENSAATTGTQKFTNALKFIGAGAALVAVTALVKGFELFKEASSAASNKLEQFTARYGAFLTSLFASGTSFRQATSGASIYIETLQKSRIELRQLSLELSNVTIKFDEANQIANDSTIGFEERNKATLEAIELSKQQAEINIKSAKIQLNVANDALLAAELAVGEGKASAEVLDKQAEAQKRYNEEVAKSDLLNLQNAEKLRQIKIDQTLLEIDLILKKREAANADKQILEEKLKDDRKEIEEKRKISQELLSVNRKTTNEELRIFKEGIGIKFDGNDLLKEQDAVILAQKIKNLKTLEGKGLGESASLELSKIIKQAQENSIANTKTQLDLDKQEMVVKQKIGEIQRQQQLDEIKFNQQIAQRNAGQLQKLLDEHTSNILDKGQLFNDKENKARNDAFNLIKANAADQADLKKQELLQDEKNNEIKANDTITSTEELNATILALQLKLDHDLDNLQNEEYIKNKDLEKKKLEDDKKIEVAKIKAIIEAEQKILSAVDDGLNKRNELQQRALETEIDNRKRAIDEQFALAVAGKENDLVFQKQKLAEDEQARKEALKKAQRQQEAIKLAETFLNALNGKLDKDIPYGRAASEALAETFAAKGISSLIAGSFIEGTENVSRDLQGNKVHNGKDGYVVAVDGDERILNPEHNRLLGSMTNDELVNRALLPNYAIDSIPNMGHNMSNSAMLIQLYGMNKKLSFLEKIAEKPDTTFHLTNLGEVIEQKVYKGVTERIKYAQTTRAKL